MPESSELFTIKLWRELLNNKQSEWRGKVQHVGSGQSRYFREWRKMTDFIADSLKGLSGKVPIYSGQISEETARRMVFKRMYPKKRLMRRFELQANGNPTARPGWHTSYGMPAQADQLLASSGSQRIALSPRSKSWLQKLAIADLVAVACTFAILSVSFLLVSDPKILSLASRVKPYFTFFNAL